MSLKRKEVSLSEVYFSTDIEADGPIPGKYSMLSFASVAFASENGRIIDTFSRNLELLPEATQHPDTMEFWRKNQAAYKATRFDVRDPKEAMTEYVHWIESIPGKPVFVAYPAGFDFMFVYWYLINFVDKSPFSFSALDMKTFAMAKLNIPFRSATKKNFPSKWFDVGDKHDHIALNDAIEQGRIFMKMRSHKQ